MSKLRTAVVGVQVDLGIGAGGGEDRDREVGNLIVARVGHRQDKFLHLGQALARRELGAGDLDRELALGLVLVLALAAAAGREADRAEGGDQSHPETIAPPPQQRCGAALLQKRGQHTATL